MDTWKFCLHVWCLFTYHRREPVAALFVPVWPWSFEMGTYVVRNMCFTCVVYSVQTFIQSSHAFILGVCHPFSLTFWSYISLISSKLPFTDDAPGSSQKFIVIILHIFRFPKYFYIVWYALPKNLLCSDFFQWFTV